MGVAYFMSKKMDFKDEWQEISFVVKTHNGLHSGPAATFVNASKGYASDLEICNETENIGWVQARSLFEVLKLNIKLGSHIKIRAKGTDDHRALYALKQTLFEALGEEFFGVRISQYQCLVDATSPVAGVIYKLPLHGFLDISSYGLSSHGIRREQCAAEKKKFHEVIASVREYWEGCLLNSSPRQQEASKIYLLLLEDPVIHKKIEQGMEDHLWSAPQACMEIYNQEALTHQALSGKSLRYQDFLDVGHGLLKTFVQQQRGQHKLNLPVDQEHDVILIGQQLSVSHLFLFPREKIQGIFLTQDTSTSHSIILAKSMRIPLYIQCSVELLDLPEGKMVRQEIHDLQELRFRYLTHFMVIPRETEQEVKRKQYFSSTYKGMHIEFHESLGHVSDVIESKVPCGLVRTEFLFLDSLSPPSLERQQEVYEKIWQIQEGDVLWFRLFDVGEDKNFWGLVEGGIDSSRGAWGWKGMRLLEDQKILFETQVEALLGSSNSEIKLLLPMIDSADSFRKVQRFIWAITKKDNFDIVTLKFNRVDRVELGCMLEVPSLAFDLKELASLGVRYVCIGLNDLTQYFWAADRQSKHFERYYHKFDAPFLRFLEKTLDDLEKYKIEYSFCGEILSNGSEILVLSDVVARAQRHRKPEEICMSLIVSSGDISRLHKYIATKGQEDPDGSS